MFAVEIKPCEGRFLQEVLKPSQGAKSYLPIHPANLMFPLQKQSDWRGTVG